MTQPEIVIRPDEASVAAEAARRFAAAVTAAVRDRGQALVALSGGSTPLAMFRLLAQPPYQTDLPWANTHIFWADERLVPPDDSGSNYNPAEQALLRHVPLPPDHIHRVHGEWPAETAVIDYTAQLAAFAAPDDSAVTWPRLDLVLLGLGSDGHTASLFPGSSVDVVAPVIAVEADYDGRPAKRLSLTPPVFNAARRILFLVTGESKAEAVASTLEGPRDLLQLPAQRINTTTGEVTWLVDAAAGQLLRRAIQI